MGLRNQVWDVFRHVTLAVSEKYSNSIVRIEEKIVAHISPINTGCPRRNVADFGRVFLMSNYTDITQNTYVQS